MNLNLISHVSAWSHLVESFNSTWFFTKLIKSQATKEPCSAASNYSSLCGSGSLPFLLLFVHKRQGISPLSPKLFSAYLRMEKSQWSPPSVCTLGRQKALSNRPRGPCGHLCLCLWFSAGGLCLVNRLQGWLQPSRRHEVLRWQAFHRAEVWQKGLV